MCHEKINCPITGIAGNTDTAPLEVSTEFYPIVKLSKLSTASSSSDSIKNNVILETFESSDSAIERKKLYIEKKDYCQLTEGEDYFVPYVRMWPNLSGERIFEFTLNILRSKDNCSPIGDIYVEMPKTITGLEIRDVENNIIKDAPVGSPVMLKLALTSNVDRSPTEIKDVPLIFYVLNHGEKTEVGRVHLSVAPKDVFSKAEVDIYLNKFKQVQDRINEKENYCLPAFREALEALLNIKANNANERNKLYKQKFNTRTQNYDNYIMQTYCNALSDIGVAKHFFSTAYNLNPKITTFTYWGKEYKVSQMPTTMVSSVSEKCNAEMISQIGYHILGVSLINGSHVMSIVVNNTSFNEPQFTLSDYHVNGTNEYIMQHIDGALNAHSIGAWKYFFVAKGKGVTKSNSKLDLWKIQNF